MYLVQSGGRLTHRVCFRLEEPGQTHSVEEAADGEHVEDSPHHRHQEDGAQLVKEQSVWHEVPRLTDYRRQQENEEYVWGESHRPFILRCNEEEE